MLSMLVAIIMAISLQCLATSEIFAADGYKDVKFGISVQKLRSMHKCSLIAMDSSSGLDAYACGDLLVGGKPSGAAFIFVDGKLKRVAIIVGDSEHDFFTTFDVLREKYGKKFNGLAPGALDSFEAGKISDLQVDWPSDDIILVLIRLSDQKVVVKVIYSASDYEVSRDKIKAGTLKNDL